MPVRDGPAPGTAPPRSGRGQRASSGPRPDLGDSHQFGTSVALSADGDIALVGGPFDNGYNGAAWGPSNFGSSVALSGDGSTGFVGGPNDASTAGAAWAFLRSPPSAGPSRRG
ncbi:MAG TPA: hypothetical protein VME46_12300 [Acidimicrobiales bacterium]|nr:hypothetical protein [Acidimicrobiales bacterium]